MLPYTSFKCANIMLLHDNVLLFFSSSLLAEKTIFLRAEWNKLKLDVFLHVWNGPSEVYAMPFWCCRQVPGEYSSHLNH